MRKKNIGKQMLAFLLAAAMVCGFAGCGKNKDSKPVTDTQQTDQTEYGTYEIALSLSDKETVSILAPKVSEYLALDTDDTPAIAAFLNSAQTTWYEEGVASISWSNAGADSYDVLFSEKETLEDALVVSTTETELSLSACTFLMPGKTYYWKVIGRQAEGRGSFSKTGSFTVKDEILRVVSVDGVENVRDLGGWEIGDSQGKVKYGMIYRGGRLNPKADTQKGGITTSGITVMKENLGMRSEIDLRNGSDNDGQTQCAWDSAGFYKLYSIGAYDQLIPGQKGYDKTYTEAVANIFTYLADKSHYPVYIHCNYGADRTGSVAFLINGLLGVSYKDLLKDFELTSLTPSERRWRSQIVKQESGAYGFLKNGIMQNDDQNYVALGHFHQMLMKKYGKGTDLAGAIETYLRQACGVKAETIAAVKEILIEK